MNVEISCWYVLTNTSSRNFRIENCSYVADLDSEAPLYVRAHVLIDQLKALKIEEVLELELYFFKVKHLNYLIHLVTSLFFHPQ